MDDAENDNGIEGEQELVGYRRTTRTATDEQLSRAYGRPVCGSESPLCEDHGAWVREYDDQGGIVGWRYWLDPVQD